MPYTRQQKHIARTIIAVGQRRGESRKEILSALSTALVEANLGNPAGGTGSSVGWRQETSAYGSVGKRRNVKGAANRYYNETSAAGNGRGMSVGNLSQAVQRSAFPDRYGQRVGQAKDILNAYNQGSLGGTVQRWRRTGEPGVDRSGQREQLLAQYLTQRENPDALLELGTGLANARDTPSTLGRERIGGGGGRYSSPGASRAAGYIQTGVAKDRQKLPYRWGGGHGAQPASLREAVDCSGFISEIVKTKRPLVSGEFTKWGRPGRGKWATVYANDHHVLMSVRDPKTGRTRWFATSQSNPGGGAGEIPPPSRSYLSSFVARHPGR